MSTSKHPMPYVTITEVDIFRQRGTDVPQTKGPDNFKSSRPMWLPQISSRKSVRAFIYVEGQGFLPGLNMSTGSRATYS